MTGYSSPVALATAPVITDRIGQGDGYYFLCVIAGNTNRFDATWQQPSHASMRFKRLDSQPPMVVQDYEIEVLQNAYRLVFLTGADGTSGLGLGFTKRGPPSATDCSNPQDYRVQISIPPIVRTSDMPDRICFKISDRAGNVAEPAVFDFGTPAMMPNAAGNAASRVRGRVAPGSNFRVDTFNLTAVTESSSIPVPTLAGVRMWVLDVASHTIPVEMTQAGPSFVHAVMPETAAPGPATVLVQSPQGSRISQPVSIARTAPGLYPVTGVATPLGFASGFGGELFSLATCQNNSSACYTTRVPLSSTEGGLDFVVYATGLRACGSVKLRIGTHTLNSVEVRRHPQIAGVDELHFHLASDFPLRLYQIIAAETPEGTSNYLWIYLE